MMTSVASGRWGPCASVEPTGTSTSAPRSRALCASVQVISPSSFTRASRAVARRDRGRRALAQLRALHLAAITARQLRDEHHAARHLVTRQPGSCVLAQLLGERVTGLLAVLRDDVGERLGEAL